MKDIFKNIYEGKKILITGHNGFKGTWLSLWLKELGAEVLGYSLANENSPNTFEAINLKNSVTSVTGDIRDEEKLTAVMQGFQPEIVFHLAAQALVRRSYRNPKYTYETNIMGTVNLLEAVRKTPTVKVVVNVTSDKCYENREWVYGYRENEAMGGYDPYSSSKGASEIVTASYRNSFFNPKEYKRSHNVSLATARAGNVIGGGDWSEDRIIPDCIRALSQGKPLIIRNPSSIRPWQHVLEPISGYLHLASMMYLNGFKYSEGWNFGPDDNDTLTVEEVASKAVEIWGKGEYKVNSDSKLHEANLLKLDINKAKTFLNWKPTYGSNTAIEATINWYKNYYQNTDMRSYSVNQIKDYVVSANEKNINWGSRAALHDLNGCVLPKS